MLALSIGSVQFFGMVNKSTKERGKKGKQASMVEEKPPAEEARQPGASEESEENSASEETALQPEVNEEEKAHGVEESAQETATEEKANAEEPAKKSRGRPKKTDSEPAAKKAKTEKKERSRPERTSTRVANQKAGIKLQKTEELPDRKRSPTKKASKDNGLTASEQNGAALEVS